MVLTEQTQTDPYPVASHESSTIPNERLYYSKVDSGRVNKSTVSGYPSDTYTSPNDYIQKLNGSGTRVGTGIVLKVMAGDKFNLRCNSWWNSGATPGTPVSPLTDLLSALNGSVSAVSGGHYTTTDLSSNSALNPGATDFLNSHTGYSTTIPKAFVNWVLFDEQFKFVSSSSGFEQVGTSNTFTPHTRTNVVLNKSGYLYIYVSNETPNIDVFFDNLQVTHVRGLLISDESFYPFGERMFNLCDRALNFGDPENKKKKFQGQEYNDDLGVDIYEFKYRMDDPQIGRFWQIDPLSNKYVYNSTYAFSENKVIAHVELEGLEAKLAIAGSSTDHVNYSQNEIDLMKGRADKLSRNAGYKSIQVNSGVQLLNALKDATKTDGSIESAVFFSHGTGSGLMFNHNDGFYTENTSYDGDNSANVSNLKYSVDKGDIKFEKNASIVLGACNCGRPGELSNISLGESITQNTGVTTYAATNYINLTNGENTGKLITGGTFIKFEKTTTVIPLEPNKKQQTYPPIIINEIKKTDVGKVLDLQKIK